ncbi:hypothetical protein [Streptomyces sp. NPDC000931]|uniref:hypothetical protein n=1 Tax=Streptomyces sp. NPDC000931 TaxID=3154372 RepID=UPI00331682DE
MTVDLSDLVGVRQSITAILPARLKTDPSWPSGPLPFELGTRRTDAATRQTYFAPAAARALYARRWHRTVSAAAGPLRLVGLELLHAPTPSAPQQALTILHFEVTGPHLLSTLRAIGHRPGAGPDPLTGPHDPAVLFAGVADTRSPAGPFAIVRPYTVAFLSPRITQTAALREPSGALPASADRWLWSLASRSTEADFPTPPEHFSVMEREAVRISADWSALILRHGAAFLGHRSDGGDGDFYGFAALHTRTVYLDALLLGAIQRDHIDALTDDLSAVFDGPGLARRVASLEQHIALFRSTYWRQHLTAHGPANELLLAYQAQHRLPERFTEILAEAADYSRLVQTQESQQIAGALGVLTILGLPVSTALGILQVMGDQDPVHLLIALAGAFAVTAGALTTRYGRLVLSSLRGGRPG